MEVEFTRVMDERGLTRARPTFEWYEFVSSHRMLFGREDVFGAARLRLGIASDGCAEPAFPADEARRLLVDAALGMVALADSQLPCPDRRFFRLVRLIGMSLLLARNGWADTPEERDMAVLRRLGDGWFLDRATEALDFHELYREAVSFFSPSPSASISQDWRSLCQGWLLAAGYLDAHGAETARMPIMAGLLTAMARRRVECLADRVPGRRAGFPDRLFRLLVAWYYWDA